MGEMVSADVADELPVAADDLVVVGDDMEIEPIQSLTPQAAPVAGGDDVLPDDPVALLQTLLARVQANRRAA
jgi:hypothetical protein